MEHTKGDWTINGGIIEVVTETPEYHQRHRIAVVGTPNMQTEEDTANARLIAAAPDLLAACEATILILDEVKNYLTGDDCSASGLYTAENELATAIAKAKA